MDQWYDPGQLPSDETLAKCFERLALEAGRAIMDVFNGAMSVEFKSDASPVTEADKAAERIILAGLAGEIGPVPCVAEEAVSAGMIPLCDDGAYLLVDPLDGTREFVNRKTDFTVNIALIRDGRPEVGVVYAPARGLLYSGRPGAACEVKIGADYTLGQRRPITVRTVREPPVIVASRSHRTPETDEFISRYHGATTTSVGSSLKFCMVAAAEADFYPRFGPTMQWDTAAGDAVLRAAGGMTRTVEGEALAYRPGGARGDFYNPFFIASGREAGRR